MFDRYRLVRSFFSRPILPFAIEFLVLAPLVLAPDPWNAAVGYMFLLPWLLVILGAVNLPFVALALRAFRRDIATRRNHVLEHATIHYLEAGIGRRLSGRAASNGFRVCGGASAEQIRSAFQQVCTVVRQGGQLPFVSRRCGSNVVSALGLALLLLSVVVLGSLVFRVPLAVRASALTIVVLFFVAMRHGIGNWVQRRFFMAADFGEVFLRDVRKIPPGPMDRGPVHFVETIVRAKEARCRPTRA